MYTLLIGHNGSILFRQREALLRKCVPDGTLEIYDTSKGPFRRLRAALWSVLFFVRFALSRQRRNVVFHGAYSPVFWILLLLGRIHGISILQGSELNTDFKGWRAHLIRTILLRSKLVVCRNEAQRLEAERLIGVPANRCIIVHWGLNPELFDIPRPVLGTDIVVISARATQAEYNIPAIFEAVKRLRQEGGRIHFVYVRFNATFEIDALDIADEVLDCPEQPELWRAIAASDIAVSVPDYDGLSNTLMETLALGSFPLSSDLPPYAFLSKDSRLGSLVAVSPGEPRETADHIYAALQRAMNRVDEIRRAAEFRRDYAEQHFRNGQGILKLCEALRA